MSTLKTFFRKHLGLISGLVIGGIAGFLYWHFIGCSSGSCAITSVWYNSTGYGAIIGGLIGNNFGTHSKNNKSPAA